MPVSPDALAEMEMLDLNDDTKPGVGVSRRNGVNTEEDDIANDRRSIHEISKMADRMSLLLQESRNINGETDDRLRQIEADLSLIALEK